MHLYRVSKKAKNDDAWYLWGRLFVLEFKVRLEIE